MAIFLVLVFVLVVLYLTYYLLFKNLNYWKSRNVPYANPLPIFGNYKDFLLLRKNLNQIVGKICEQFPDEPYIGSFYGTSPALIIQDPSLLKFVMLKEFYHFNGREASDYNHKETLSMNIFSSHGDQWKVLRTNLSPLFSSMKLKKMFYIIKKSSDTLENLIADEIKANQNIDIKKLLSRFTIECITACAFGLHSGTMKDGTENNPFIAFGDHIFNTSDIKRVKDICRSMWPGIFYALGFKMSDKKSQAFFRNIVSGVFKTREETNIVKNDFVDLVLTWRKHNYLTGEGLGSIKTGDRKTVSIEVNDELLIAQCVVFFAAGFETTSTSTSFLLYELAKNQNAQERMIEEVDRYFAKHETIEYECISTLPYIEACIAESLRLYPVLPVITREVRHDLSLPTGLHLRRGDRVHIPVGHLHHNPKYFPEPDAFRPERFLGEAKENIQPFTYLPFGEGPRTCIGMRFSKMPMYSALLKIFKSYRVELAENMPHKLTFNPKSIVSQPIGGIHIKFIPRNA